MSAATLDAPLVASSSPAGSRSRLWAGRILYGIVLLFLAMDVGVKLAQAKPAVDGTVQAGYQPHHVLIIGLIGLVCLVAYVVPRTAPLGALLWTGYLGGAVATNLRLDLPLLSHTLFPIYVAALIWGALYLRDERVRTMVR